MAHIKKTLAICVAAHAIEFSVVNRCAIEIISVTEVEFFCQGAAHDNRAIGTGYFQHSNVVLRFARIVVNQIVAIWQFYKPIYVR